MNERDSAGIGGVFMNSHKIKVAETSALSLRSFLFKISSLLTRSSMATRKQINRSDKFEAIFLIAFHVDAC